jgi:hypothetical protein
VSLGDLIKRHPLGDVGPDVVSVRRAEFPLVGEYMAGSFATTARGQGCTLVSGTLQAGQQPRWPIGLTVTGQVRRRCRCGSPSCIAARSPFSG